MAALSFTRSITLVLLLSGPFSWASEAMEKPIEHHKARLLATFGPDATPLDQEQLNNWLQYGTGKGVTTEKDAIQNLILIKTLADEARRRGYEEAPRHQFAIERGHITRSRSLLRKYLWQQIKVSDQQVETLYQSIKDSYTLPRRVRLYNLFKRFPVGASPIQRQDTLASIEALRQNLINGADFKELATRESNSQTRLNGGLMGNVRAGTLPSEVDQVVMQLKAGEISQVLASKDGYTLFYCEKILEKVYRPPAELRKISRDMLEQQAFREAKLQLEKNITAQVTPRYFWSRFDTSDGNFADTRLVEFNHGGLTAQQVAWLMNEDDVRKLAGYRQQAMQRKIEAHIFGLMEWRQVKQFNLDDSAETQAREYWKFEQVLADQVILNEVKAVFQQPTPEQVRNYYDSHQGDFKRHAHYKLAVIKLTQAADESTSELHDKAYVVANDINSGEIAFADAARKYSSHPSRNRSGELAWISRYVLPHRLGINVLRQVLIMQPGEISAPVASDDGSVWIIALREIEAARPMHFQEAEQKAENGFANQQLAELRMKFLTQWFERQDVKLHSEIGTPAP